MRGLNYVTEAGYGQTEVLARATAHLLFLHRSHSTHINPLPQPESMDKDVYLNRVLDLSYQSGQIGLAGMGLVITLVNPYWFRHRLIYISLLVLFTSTVTSGAMALYRNNFENGSAETCRSVVYGDLTAYFVHMTTMILMMIYRLVILFRKRTVLIIMAAYLFLALGSHIFLLVKASPRLETTLAPMCKTGVPDWLYSFSDAFRMVTEVSILITFLVRIFQAAMAARALGSSMRNTFYDVIITKGIFRIIAIILLDCTLIALTNIDDVPYNSQKSVRLLANALKFSLFLSDYLDYRFIGSGKSDAGSTMLQTPLTPRTPSPMVSPTRQMGLTLPKRIARRGSLEDANHDANVTSPPSTPRTLYSPEP